MGIQPNTIVKVLKGVPCEKSYRNTLYWLNKLNQSVYFSSKAKYTYTNQTYQRYALNVIRVQQKADELYDCNYLMFQNSSYGNKWFYCFITGVDYINDNTTAISYEIDLMQTYYFDYDLLPCYVEREHSTTDKIGDNLVTENFDVEPIITYAEYDYSFTELFGGIYLKKPIYTSEGYVTIDGTTYYIGDAIMAQGTTTALLYAGLCVRQPYTETFAELKDNYNCAINSDNIPFFIDDLVKFIVQGKVKTDAENYLQEDDIISVYLYPKQLNQKNNEISAQSISNWRGFARGDILVPAIAPSFNSLVSGKGTYIPKNNKLFTSPFVCCEIDNHQGDTLKLHYEYFTETDPVLGIRNLEWVGSYTQADCSLVFYPPNYLGSNCTGAGSVSLSVFPTFSYIGDNYAQYYVANKNQIEAQKTQAILKGVSSAVLLAISVALAVPTGGTSTALVAPTAAAQLATTAELYSTAKSAINIGKAINSAQELSSSIASIQSSVAQVKDMMNEPGNFYGSLSSSELIGYCFNKITLKSKTIPMETAKSIDNFFTMFGYAIKQIKIPNRHARARWTYTKTNGCLIKVKDDGSMNASDEENIQNIYDNGITFWVNPNDVGDYTLDNSVL